MGLTNFIVICKLNYQQVIYGYSHTELHIVTFVMILFKVFIKLFVNNTLVITRFREFFIFYLVCTEDGRSVNLRWSPIVFTYIYCSIL